MSIDAIVLTFGASRSPTVRIYTFRSFSAAQYWLYWVSNIGTGSVQGTTGSDNVNIAGLVLKTLAFGTAQVESSEFGANAVP